MRWRRTEGDERQGKAVSDAGFRMDWATSKFGVFYNAWTPAPNARVLAAGYDKTEVKAACDRFNKNRDALHI